MPDDILDAAKTITEDPPVTNQQLPPEPPPVPVIPMASGEPAPAKQPDVSELFPAPPPINEKEEKLVSELLASPVVPAQTPPVASEKPLAPSGGMKKKGITGGVIAIIAMLLLTLPVAVYFLSQQNQQITDVRSRATNPLYSGCQTGPSYACCVNDPGACAGQGGPNACHCQGGQACTGTACQDIETNCRNDGREWCTNSQGFGKTCCARGYGCGDKDGCFPIGDDTGDDDTTNPTNTPTPTTGNTPVCQNIKIYKNGTQVTDLPSLRAGDAVILAVKGNLTPTKAHFRVNGGGWTETTTTNSSGEFTLAYTMPAGVTDFVIEGEVFTNGAWR